jgi:hypothetical protein
MQMSDYAIQFTLEVFDDNVKTTNHAFPRLLFSLLSDPDVKSVRWTPDGQGFKTSFDFLKHDLKKYLTPEVSLLDAVPQFFSFLAFFEFTRTAYEDSWMWHHPAFVRSDPEKMVDFNKQNGYCALCFPLKPPLTEVGSVREPPKDTSADVEGPRRVRPRRVRQLA